MKKVSKQKPLSYWNEFVPKIWEVYKEKYTWKLFKHDLISGITVGVVALPITMAFAIASGVSPVHGLYTAIIAGFLISLLGGSYFQIGGPTGAFVIIIYDIVARHGYDGLVVATLLAGIILLASAFSRLGMLIKYIPYPLIVGFTSGIAVAIFSSQIKDFFGLHITKVPIDFIPKWMALFHGFSTWDPLTFAVALSTLLLIILIRRYFPVIPWGIGSIVVVTATTWGFDLPVETIASRFGEIPSLLPTFSLPHFSSSFLKWHTFIPDAITIAFLAGIESLLSAVVADGMTGRRHKSNCELMAQGIANIISVLFGGIPATGAVARTAVSIKSGAKTPVAGMIHAVVLLVIILTCASTVSQISLASLSAVLMVIAWNMAEIKHFRRIFKSPPGDILVLLVTFLITVLVDLTTAVGVGMILAAFLFMKRVSDFSAVSPILILEQEKNALQKPDPDRIEKKEIATGVEVYEIEGPFFFGVTERLKDLVAILKSPPRVFILRMRKVPMIDASGMHALEDFYYKCHRDKTVLLLSEVNSAVLYSLKKFGLLRLLSEQHIFSHIDPALAYAEKCAKAS